MKNVSFAFGFALLMLLYKPLFAQELGFSEAEASKCFVSGDRPHLHIINANKTPGAICALAKGDIVQVRLPIRPGTGYQWRLEGGSAAFRQLGEGNLTPMRSGEPGASETEVLNFIVDGKGSQRLTLGYSRNGTASSTKFTLIAKAF